MHFAGTHKKLPLQIWDIPGADKFRTLSTIYFRDADAAVLVFDVTNKESFDNLKTSWLKDLNAVAPDTMLKFIVGNKQDLLEDVNVASSLDQNQIVTEKMLREFGLAKKSEFRCVSARKNTGIDEMFQRLGERLIETVPTVSKLYFVHRRKIPNLTRFNFPVIARQRVRVACV